MGPALALVLQGAAVAAMIARAACRERDRAAWTAVSAAVATGGRRGGRRVVMYGDGPRPSPSLPDLFYTAFFPLLYGGAGLLMLRRAPRFQPSIWLDGVILATTVTALVGSLLVGPPGTLLYPVGGSVLVM